MCRLLITTLQHCSTIRLIWYSFVTPQKNSSQSFRAFSPHRIGKVFHFHGVFLVAAKHRASIDLLICRLLKSVGICEHKMRERGFLDFGGAKNTLWKTSAKNGGLVTWFMWPGDSVQVPYWKTKFEFLHNFPEVDRLLHWRLPWEGSLSQGKSDVINIHSSSPPGSVRNIFVQTIPKKYQPKPLFATLFVGSDPIHNNELFEESFLFTDILWNLHPKC